MSIHFVAFAGGKGLPENIASCVSAQYQAASHEPASFLK
jgi:hypothetical protein